MRDYILLFINGKQYRLSGEQAFMPLAAFLRYESQLTGTKIVCDEGDCGACSVLIGKNEEGKLAYKPVNSCIQFCYQLDCAHIITVEGLRSDASLTEVQKAMVEHQGAQCGYCTPGIVVAMSHLFNDKACAFSNGSCPDAVKDCEIKDALTGNLCRCTGYEPIIKAGLAVDVSQVKKLEEIYPSKSMLNAFAEHSSKPYSIEYGERKIYGPADLKGACAIKAANPKAVLVSGATDVCVNHNKRSFLPEASISLSSVSGLDDIEVAGGILSVGARVTLQKLETFVQELIPELYEILLVFGSPQIKYAGTLAGNIANASPIADTIPSLFVLDAELELTGVKATRKVKVGSFYKGYKQLDLNSDEIISRILIPLPKAHELLRLYKVSKRKNLDISSFTAAFLMQKSEDKIESIRIAYGGVGPVVLRLPKAEAFLTGRAFTLDNLRAAGQIARQEITPISDVRGASEFRLELAETIMEKFFFECAGERELACLQ